MFASLLGHPPGLLLWEQLRTYTPVFSKPLFKMIWKNSCLKSKGSNPWLVKASWAFQRCYHYKLCHDFVKSTPTTKRCWPAFPYHQHQQLPRAVRSKTCLKNQSWCFCVICTKVGAEDCLSMLLMQHFGLLVWGLSSWLLISRCFIEVCWC